MTEDRGSREAAPPLKLAALDAEDLSIVSAHLQDAIVKVGDMVFLPREQRFALMLARFDWAGAMAGPCERCQAGLHFERVSRVRRSGFEQRQDVELRLLAITFVPDQAPSGRVLLAFADGAAIALEVECLECALRDLGPRWSVGCKPVPAIDSTAAEA